MKDVEDKPEQQTRTRETDKSPTSTEPRQQPSALFARGNRKAVKSPQRSSSKIKENKHPFALYGWGEKQTDTGSQKTHNVCASAPVHEVRSGPLWFCVPFESGELGHAPVIWHHVLWSLSALGPWEILGDDVVGWGTPEWNL